MDKLNCIEDYFCGTRAYYLYKLGIYFNKPEYMDFILDKRNLNAAKVGFVSNIMLGIKEDLVDNIGDLVYQSKVFLASLENAVEFVATKVENGYKVGNYIFPDAATLVAIVRNKLAHGKYMIDFEHNRVILQHKGVEIVINIDKLINFIIMSFRNTMKETRKDKYERNLVYYTKGNNFRTDKIKDLAEVKRMVKSYNYVSFTVESVNGLPVPADCIILFENFLEYFKLKTYASLKEQKYKDLVNVLNKRGCKISYEYKTLVDEDEIDRILKFADSEIIGNENLNYQQQVKVLGMEVQKSINNEYNTFNAIAANVNNLIILNAITKIKSVNNDDISAYITSVYPDEIKSGYDEFGMTLLSMFNSLFIYPFDDVYDTSGGYTPMRIDSFDFSLLDLSMVNPSMITIDESPLVNAKARLDSLINKQAELSEKLRLQQENLKKVSGNVVAQANINNSIASLKTTLASLFSDYMMVDGEYHIIKNDFTVNSAYFRNKAIIEGIRNSIAHGHYEFISNGDYWDTVIVFNDIYEGKLTFQLKISFADLEKLINVNYRLVLDYVENKNILSKSNIKSRK